MVVAVLTFEVALPPQAAASAALAAVPSEPDTAAFLLPGLGARVGVGAARDPGFTAKIFAMVTAGKGGDFLAAPAISVATAAIPTAGSGRLGENSEDQQGQRENHTTNEHDG